MKVKKYQTVLSADFKPQLCECGSFVADGRRSYCSPELLADFFGDSVGIRQAATEHVYVACLDTKLHLVGCFEASHGAADCSMFPVREVLQKSLMIGGVSIAVCHNHPSGDTTPSGADISATKQLKAACDVVGLSLIDHVIIGANNARFYSFHESGVLE